MPAISMVMATFNRAKYLRRSLECYCRQTFKDFELVVIDDDSTDDTEELLDSYRDRLDINYVKVSKEPGQGWRDAAVHINHGIKLSKGELVIGTHPEVMPGDMALQAMWESRAPNAYICCNIYYLSGDNQTHIDEVDWQNEGVLAVRNLPNFYTTEDNNTNNAAYSDYSHHSTDQHPRWESWVMGGMLRSEWYRIGGFREFKTWGSGDVDFLNRRILLQFENRTMLDDRTICCHQNHDDLGQGGDRDMKACMAALPRYTHPGQAILDYLK